MIYISKGECIMNEIEKRKDMAMSLMDMELIPDMDEKILAEEYNCKKFSFTDLAALGVAFQQIMSMLQQRITGEGGSGLYFVNTMGRQMFHKKGSTDFIGSLKTDIGSVGGGQASLMQLPCDPTMICLAVALVGIELKFNEIKNIQIEMLEYVKSTQRAKIRGDINTLSDVMSNYKFNCNNEKYKTNKHILVQDIKKESEQALSLHTEQIVKTLNKSDDWHWDNDVQQVKNKLKAEFDDYKLSLFLYSYASFLEVMLLENFDKDYLNSISDKIEEKSKKYDELFDECCKRIEKASKSSVETFFTKGLSDLSRGFGKVIASIPVICEGPVDEGLIGAGDQLEKWNTEKSKDIIDDLAKDADVCAVPFLDNIKMLNKVYNEPIDMLIGSDGVYLVEAPKAV